MVLATAIVMSGGSVTVSAPGSRLERWDGCRLTVGIVNYVVRIFRPDSTSARMPAWSGLTPRPDALRRETTHGHDPGTRRRRPVRLGRFPRRSGRPPRPGPSRRARRHHHGRGGRSPWSTALFIGLAAIGGHGPSALTSRAAGPGWAGAWPAGAAGVGRAAAVLSGFLGRADERGGARCRRWPPPCSRWEWRWRRASGSSPAVIAGGLICLAAVVLVSLEHRPDGPRNGPSLASGCAASVTGSPRASCSACFSCSSATPGASGVLWPVADRPDHRRRARVRCVPGWPAVPRGRASSVRRSGWRAARGAADRAGLRGGRRLGQRLLCPGHPGPGCSGSRW